MAHNTLKSSYHNLEKRLNLFPQGATPSILLNKILKLLFTKTEAKLISVLPLRPFTA